MYDLYIFISRYVFLILAVLFAVSGLVYMRACGAGNERLIRECGFIQRLCIVLTHVLAYTIIIFASGDAYNNTQITVAIASLVFLPVAFISSAVVYRRGCALIINCVLFLMNIGLIMLTRLNADMAMRQLVWFIAGFLLFLLIPLILKLMPRLDKLSFLYITAAVFFLVLPFFIGATRGGARNWIVFSIAGTELSFQPSEIVKFLFVFYLACVFKEERRFKEIIFPAAACMALILALTMQNDLGGALIFFVTFMSLLYIGTGNVLYIAGGITAFSAAASLAYKLFPHLQRRVSAWRDPWSDITNSGWQIAQSLFAVGTWGPFGSGLTRGLPSSIPIAETDFIFSAISEEFGILFGFVIIAVYLILAARGLLVSIHAKERCHSLLSAGFTSMLIFQAFLIIGGNMRFIPLTGVTLPFVSYGGSSVVVSLLMAAIIEWVAGRGEALEQENEEQ